MFKKGKEVLKAYTMWEWEGLRAPHRAPCLDELQEASVHPKDLPKSPGTWPCEDHPQRWLHCSPRGGPALAPAQVFLCAVSHYPGGPALWNSLLAAQPVKHHDLYHQNRHFHHHLLHHQRHQHHPSQFLNPLCVPGTMVNIYLILSTFQAERQSH